LLIFFNIVIIKSILFVFSNIFLLVHGVARVTDTVGFLNRTRGGDVVHECEAVDITKVEWMIVSLSYPKLLETKKKKIKEKDRRGRTRNFQISVSRNLERQREDSSSRD
jgi:hypothetical protein